MHIYKDAAEHTSLRLTEKEGEYLRELILNQIDCSWPSYLRDRVGMHPNNVYAYLTGAKPISIKNIRRLLSGTRITIEECQLNIILGNTSGGIVNDVDSTTLEDVLHSVDGATMNQPDLPDWMDESNPFSLGKPQEPPKTPPDTPSWENQDES